MIIWHKQTGAPVESILQQADKLDSQIALFTLIENYKQGQKISYNRSSLTLKYLFYVSKLQSLDSAASCTVILSYDDEQYRLFRAGH